MPNHVTSIITAPKLVIEAITRGYTPEEIQSYKDEIEELRERELTQWFTAERKESALKIREARAVEMLTEKITDFNMAIPQPVNIETGGCSRQHEEGVICWYEWNPKSWGTKWNAYETTVEPRENGLTELRFDTAWSHPYPVLEKLSKKFPSVLIQVSYADEDLGHNIGQYAIKNGERSDLLGIEEGSDEANDFAAHIKYGKTYAELEAEWEV
ncbi:hypothetical protein ACFO7V_16755 [Glutamicibacter bergerei]|uniref:YubB ferredoxin-like domain-containing protein n=1 Tax=Glutamicibacter bergerei TaxID=256702 RepID=A0ABV9MRY1_9MICC|nr:hypothetical protein [Micrococcaceae bacterium]